MPSTPSRKSASRLGVPVQPVEVDLAARRPRASTRSSRSGTARVGEHGLQGRQPHGRARPAGAPPVTQREVLAARRPCRARRRRPRSSDLDQPGVHGHAPGLARVRGASVVARAGRGRAPRRPRAAARRRVRRRRRPGCPGPAQRASRTARASSGVASASRASSASECSRTGGRVELSDIGWFLLRAYGRAEMRAAPATRRERTRRVRPYGSAAQPRRIWHPCRPVHVPVRLGTWLKP